ncbi:MAG: ComF family protein [Pirellulales bacterium]|nr:ComF family protein [Pirellulales bacterium]
MALLQNFWHGSWAAWQIARDLIFPPVCLTCQVELSPPVSRLICEPCARRLVPTGKASCPRCGAYLEVPLFDGVDCRDCRDAKFAFERVVALGSYEGLLRDAILRCKSAHEFPLVHALGQLFVDSRREELRAIPYQVVVPIPMHWWRRWRRGINAPEHLAQALAAVVQAPVGHGLVRKRPTKPQGELSARQRRLNLRGAFAFARGVNYAGATVLLVDDILTSGSTCHQAAKLLLAGGAARVDVAVLARAFFSQT